ncbi:sulfotransferase family protein [Aliiruegeria lutimaris]|uniref:Sulfotransferase domain-containing protein n=1 Tax=Aliiruegeria lutimaris TaxID=571298 RepID=A0A1G9DUR7_9RHOB|nr:sulfotransferase domain-containing protein [Aliiruegeria lutimaris]SDK67621.1 Sulfotransferase domain-containing protein [Aliiruegeria lutimaris]
MEEIPDFVIIGAMKCGTSTLQAQLAIQPGIFMTTPKEPNYFSDDDVFARGKAWYAGLFAERQPGDLTGEASTHYTKLPTHPRTLDRMGARLNSPKLIYLMRDPLERAISHYIHEWSMGVMGEDPAEEFERHPELTDYSCYGMQLAPYVERYGREAILLLQMEDMKSDPQGTLDQVSRFLGREGFQWDPDLGTQNVSAERVRRLPFHDLIVDNEVATRLRRALVPKSVRRWIRSSRQMRDRPELPEDLKERLRVTFSEDQEKLRALFPSDRTISS